MAAADMNAPPCERAEAVRVGVVLTAVPEGEDCVVIGEDGHSVQYKPVKNEEAKSFSFDQVVTLDNMQSLHPQLLQPLTEAISRGFNGALLLCGASTEKVSTLIDRCVIKQVLVDLLSQAKEERFISVSVLQFYPDGSAVDLLSPSRRTLTQVTHPVLGNLVAGLCEVCVCSAEEACALYETCRESLKAGAGSLYSTCANKTLTLCSSLFSVAVEWKLHPEQAESEVCRGRLQLFSLAGGASRTDLRGVIPLLKVVDQTQHEATTSDLHFLLNEALTGNSRTVVIYCVHPPDDEARSALTLAQKARGLVTKATSGRWCLRATEQEIRDKISELKTRMMSQGENEVHNTYRLAELTQNLQIVKNQSWEKRREQSQKIKQSCPTAESHWHSSHLRESTDTTKGLQEHLKREMEEHIREGKGPAEKVRERVWRIQQLGEALREERRKPEKPDLCRQSQLEYNDVQERRRQLREDCGRLIEEAVERMERDLAKDQTEGLQRELLVLSSERRILVLQIEALRAEAQRAERDLQDQHHRHQRELQCLKEESLQVFRVFHQVSEEQRKVLEGRYRAVLLEAVHDAIYLSAQNQQVQADNKLLRKALAEMKDTVAARGDRKAEPLS